jgi:hypothetical protein
MIAFRETNTDRVDDVRQNSKGTRYYKIILFQSTPFRALSSCPFPRFWKAKIANPKVDLYIAK